jgi:5'-deoxynucleotidase YfbR-like HD superfamily hydrolase
MDTDRLAKQIQFILEIDKAKQVLRRTLLLDQTRCENDAEHSWHLAVIALLFCEYAGTEALDLLRVVKMVLIHDIVEIDAGDIFIYDTAGMAQKEERERRAAERIFRLLPEDQGGEFRALWDEFEERATPEARFAGALDRLQPLLHNYHTQGASWRAHGITSHQVIAMNRHIAEGAPALWDFARALIEDAVRQGYLEAGAEPI